MWRWFDPLDEKQIMAALVETVNSSTRSPALSPLAYIKYPWRELCPDVTPDGELSFDLAFWGWEYKHRGPRKPPGYVNPAAIQTALNAALPDTCAVTAVEDRKTHIKIILEVLP